MIKLKVVSASANTEGLENFDFTVTGLKAVNWQPRFQVGLNIGGENCVEGEIR